MTDPSPREAFEAYLSRARLYVPGLGMRPLLSGEQAAEITAAAGAWAAAVLRQLAADLEAEASAITGLDAPPWAAMYGLKVTSGAEAALILRRAAELALRRAEGRAEAPRGGRGQGRTGERT